jgi:hypothetical protein
LRLPAGEIERITVSANRIAISLRRAALTEEIAGSPNNRNRSNICTSTDPIILQANVQLERRTQNKRLIVHGDAKPLSQPDPSLGVRHGATRFYVTRIVRLAVFAPDITHALLEGTAPPAITADSLSRRHDLRIAWPAQRAMLGLSG